MTSVPNSPIPYCPPSRRPGELARLVGEVIGQIRKLAITAANRKDHMFLGINVDRRGVVTRENLRALCENHHLPADPDVVDAVSAWVWVGGEQWVWVDGEQWVWVDREQWVWRVGREQWVGVGGRVEGLVMGGGGVGGDEWLECVCGCGC